MIRGKQTSHKTEGRYGDAQNATTPGDLPRQGTRGKQQVMHGFVDDQNPAFRGQKQRVAINVKTDALETEYAYKRISEDAYRAGRVYQRVLEMSSGKPTGGGQWMDGSRVDAGMARETAIWRSLQTTEQAIAMVDDLKPEIGSLAGKVLRMALIEGMTLSQVSERFEQRATRWNIGFYAEVFRRALQAIADHWAKSKAPC